MQTPIAVDQFSRFMVDMFDEREVIGVPTVWQSFFGRPEHASRTVFSPDANDVDIDIIRGNERLAALIHRGTDSTHLGQTQPKTNTQNYSSFSRKFPLAEEESTISAHKLLSRLAGENPYGGKTRLDRNRALALEYHLEHIRRYVRLFEVLSGNSLLSGQMPGILGTANSDLIYDFRRNPAHFVVPAVGWDQANADILNDIDEGCQQIRISGHVKPNVLFLGSQAMDAVIKNLTVQALADNRRFELIEISTNNPVPPMISTLVNSGAIARGRLRTPRGYEVWLFTYVDVYTDRNGDAQPYLPEDMAFLAYYGARCDRYYGPPERLPVTPSDAAWYQSMFGFNMMTPPMPANVANMGAIISPAMFYSDAYESPEKKKVVIRTQSAPIYATTQTDAFLTFRNVITPES